jgi:hypothetical protein
VIVVIGRPVLHAIPDAPVATGSAARIALTAAARGATVQLIGKVGDDPEGELVLLSLARGGVGHVALLRDPSHRTPRLVTGFADPTAPDADADPDLADPDLADPVSAIEPADPADRPGVDAGDVELGLRYLTEFRVIVATEQLDGELARVVTEAAGWSSATLIALVPDGAAEPEPVPDDAILLQAPADDPDGAFDRLVGELAAAIDSGVEPRTAFRDLVAVDGWEPAEA